MSPHRMALRSLLFGRPRMLAATMLVAASLCVLDLFAGHVAGERSRLEYQAVTGEGLGHLAIMRAKRGFPVEEAARAQRIAESVSGVALVVPEAQRYQVRTERLIVYLSRPADLESVRPVLLAALRREGLAAEVRSWGELSQAYSIARSNGDVALACLAGAVMVVIGATIAATLSINRIERRRELATLRALGMPRRSVFVLLLSEGLLIAGAGTMLAVLMSTSVAWVVNGIALPGAARNLAQAPLLVEPGLARVLAATAAVMVVALLAAIVPAAKAARADVVRGLAP